MEQGQLLLGVVEGRIPYGPDAKILGAKLVEAVPGSGQVTIEFDGHNFPTHVLGDVSGGFIAAMRDFIASLASATTYEKGEFGPSLELKVNFIRAAKPGTFRGLGRTVHRTKSVAFTEAELRSSSGELIATASSTLRLIRVLA
jgi:uncharacterized protein (TIGR00369 family)